MISKDDNQYTLILEKILEHIKEDKIESKKDLKLYGIDEPTLQKEVMWEIFETYVVNESNKTNKSHIIRKFHRRNLL
tara:strand:- start:202 stop:432 length:231 start_codon:yes stop_codon:yes gene_type:complete